ncbi:MAG: T9SS type A sorting domain-containing protein [Flavobacteriales bacterium]|nr:T9SS type A sorting domain-containing protein [Flavobacteriales bacterium]
MRSIILSFILLFSALASRAQTGWSVLNIPNAGRYDDIFFINDSVGWAAGGSTGWIRKTVNGGQTWTLQFTSPYYLRSIEFIDANTGFAGSLNGQLYRTTNGGQIWTDISPGISPAPDGICGLSAPTANTIYGCGLWAGPAYIIKSVNGGDDWTYIDMSAYASRLVDIHFTTPDTGFATGTANPASNGGVIIYTTNGGISWTTMHATQALTDIVWKIQRLDAAHWFASIYSEPTNDDTRMLRSIDGGMTWTQLTVSGDYTYIETIGFMDPLHGWTGGEGTLWETSDGGNTWEDIALGYNYNRFFKVNDSTAYLSGQRIYKYQGDISTGLALPEERTTTHSLSVRPNPTDGHITIDLTLDRNTIADLRIVAANGTTVQQLFRSNAAEGDHTFSANLTGGAAASYFVVLKTNEGMRYEKVVVK